MMRTIIVATIAMLAVPSTAHAQATPAAAENSGQDPTQPVTRVDVRARYQNDTAGAETGIFTLRADKPFMLGDGWKLSTRIDLPLIGTDRATPDNPAGHTEWGVGDVLVQALAIKQASSEWAYAFGGQIIAPTGGGRQFGTGKWQLVPSVAAVRQLPQISRGTFVGLLLRDAFSFAGKDSRAGINVVSVEPIFNWQLPDAWFLTTSPEIKFNTKDDWRVFLPFDLTVGKKLGPKMVASLQADVPIVDDYPQYDWRIEFRVGFFF